MYYTGRADSDMVVTTANTLVSINESVEYEAVASGKLGFFVVATKGQHSDPKVWTVIKDQLRNCK